MKFYIRYLRPVHTLGPMLDIGCGRGILLEIMREQQFDAIGIDANKDQVAICASKGLNVQLDDGYEFLKRIPSGALSAVR
jgi:O-antigen chain-terminating methyltransferase